MSYIYDEEMYITYKYLIFLIKLKKGQFQYILIFNEKILKFAYPVLNPVRIFIFIDPGRLTATR